MFVYLLQIPIKSDLVIEKRRAFRYNKNGFRKAENSEISFGSEEPV